MSCVAMALAASLALADASALPPAERPAPAQVSALSREPLYADIVARAKALEGTVDGMRLADLKSSPSPAPLPGLDGLKMQVAALSDLDMKGHFDLAKRDSDGDLKCILKGISQDLPKKLDAAAAAHTGAEQDAALADLRYVLNDNVEVITAPAKPPV